MSAIVAAITPLVLASELAWGDKDVDGADSDAENCGLSPAARRPLWRMSEEEQQVKKMLHGPLFHDLTSLMCFRGVKWSIVLLPPT